jgi:hypothetical protein
MRTTFTFHFLESVQYNYASPMCTKRCEIPTLVYHLHVTAGEVSQADKGPEFTPFLTDTCRSRFMTFPVKDPFFMTTALTLSSPPQRKPQVHTLC